MKKKSKPQVKKIVWTEEQKQKLFEVGSKFWNILNGSLSNEMKEVEKYIALDDVYRGRVLNCALVLEHLVDRYMNEQGLSKPKERKPLNGLSFSEKLERLEKTDHNTWVHYLIDGIKAINTLRNKYAHKLNFDIQKDGKHLLSRIENAVSDTSYPDFDKEKSDYPLLVIETFTKVASTIMLTQMGQVKVDLDNFKKAYPGIKKLTDKFGF